MVSFICLYNDFTNHANSLNKTSLVKIEQKSILSIYRSQNFITNFWRAKVHRINYGGRLEMFVTCEMCSSFYYKIHNILN
uniref:Uncharacterized protein n=1 Tax=Timema bartmani TaxID=61472 RepID=A0A7R9I572_9NEOP|nr:unnamed protein product [Timema bartmani]